MAYPFYAEYVCIRLIYSFKRYLPRVVSPYYCCQPLSPCYVLGSGETLLVSSAGPEPSVQVDAVKQP